MLLSTGRKLQTYNPTGVLHACTHLHRWPYAQAEKDLEEALCYQCLLPGWRNSRCFLFIYICSLSRSFPWPIYQRYSTFTLGASEEKAFRTARCRPPAGPGRRGPPSRRVQGEASPGPECSAGRWPSPAPGARAARLPRPCYLQGHDDSRHQKTLH